MLASITPLGERGRHNSWTTTVAAHIVGSTAAAALLGAALGTLGSGHEGAWRTAALLGVVAVVLVVEVGRGRLPGPHRQVDERWLDEYRGWVYGAGYGAQLGLGLTTVVVSGMVYVALAAALVSGSAIFGALIFGTFGFVRGGTVLATARVDTPQRLRDLHAWLSAASRRVARAGLAVELGLFTLLVVILLAR